MIATSATVTTLFGAQNLATFDLTKVDASTFTEPDVILVPDGQPTQDLLPQVANIQPTLEPPIIHSAPSIVILRQPGQANTTVNSANNSQLLLEPPNPVALAQPDPIIIQATPQPGQVQQQFVQQPQQQQQIVIVRNNSSNSSKSSRSKSSR
jgi:hypothetical protein